MLSKIIKLVDIYDDYMKNDSKISENDYEISQFMKITIEAFNTMIDEVVRLKAKVKKLEQKDSYYPATQEEINNIKEVRNING